MTLNFQHYFEGAISTAMQTNCTQHTAPMTQPEAESFRAFYEKTLMPWDAVANSEDIEMQKSIWSIVRAKFESVAADIERKIALPEAQAQEEDEGGGEGGGGGGEEEKGEGGEGGEKEIVLRVQGKNYVLNAQTKCATVGRIPHNDIPIVGQTASGSSRLHAIVRLFGKCLAIIDVGSFSGITCLERSNADAPCERSLANDRRPLIIGADETAVFSLGPNVTLTVNPKECTIVSSKCTGTRDFKGQCGHFICCYECALEWMNKDAQEGGLNNEAAAAATCPQCRAPFFGPRAVRNVEHANTMAGF